MAPAKTKTPKGTTSAPKKEKLFHPSSRKADQLARKALRKGKLGNLASKRGQKANSLVQVDVYGFYFHALPEEGTLTLPELHSVVKDLWLTRYDDELEQERAARRKGRPKSAREVKLEELKLRESDEYRTGFDLTHPTNVEVFRRWDQKEVAYIQLLRFIRITSTDPELVVISRPGKHISIIGVPEPAKNEDEEMRGVEEG
ncbi:hypothetical protein H0H87_003510 [Tephrocybe sp. NHM501043]|nr:hypothetical protein H0H87_003510 [Tephrocybe sp. NHM501043]